MAITNLDEDQVYMGFITQSICSECDQTTFAADGICYVCKANVIEEDRLYFKSPLGLECE
jgi:hypothetical protein